ncbi:MAG: hypothetical protein ACXWV6_13370 [Chitinophagaceae bacterium]
MTKEQIDQLLAKGNFMGSERRPSFIETHISWVLLCDHFVYKIKKPLLYSFLDFSTLEKRKYYCDREIQLNKRLTENIYLDVQPVVKVPGGFSIGFEEPGEIIDYAVRMRRVDSSRQMDLLLRNNQVTHSDIKDLAKKIAAFHKKADIIYQKDLMDIPLKFNDLENEKDFLKNLLNDHSEQIITRAVKASTIFMQNNKILLADRQKKGFCRDCHGDLHSRNIFLLPDPQPFDCIEFNDDYREIDVLNEVAFLCMDLDAFNRQDLSSLFLDYYNQLFNAMNTAEDYRLFIYYKSYRANIRAKVNSLRARTATTEADKKLCLAETDKYLKLLDHYITMLENR